MEQTLSTGSCIGNSHAAPMSDDTNSLSFSIGSESQERGSWSEDNHCSDDDDSFLSVTGESETYHSEDDQPSDDHDCRFDDNSDEEGCDSSDDTVQLGGVQIVDDYLQQRNEQLAELQRGRRERSHARNEALAASNIDLNDHPYNLAKREEKILGMQKTGEKTSSTNEGQAGSMRRRAWRRARTTPNRPDSASVSSSESLPTHVHVREGGLDEVLSAEAAVDDSIRDELIAAYRLIHKQRVRIQQLEKQQVGTGGDIPANASDQERLIRSLQSQLIRLQHNRANGEFELRGRITNDAIRYHGRLMYHKQRVEEGLAREKEAAERHQQDILRANQRIYGLEQSIKRLEHESCSVYTNTTAESSEFSVVNTMTKPKVEDTRSRARHRDTKFSWKNKGPSNPHREKPDPYGTSQATLLQNAVKRKPSVFNFFH